jgi:molybdopterin converting factor small subunit
MVIVELFGVPRLRAGVGRVEVEGATLGDALRNLTDACPALHGPVVREGEGTLLQPAYRLSLNGDRFVDNPATPLADGDTLLLFSADSGG